MGPDRGVAIWTKCQRIDGKSVTFLLNTKPESSHAEFSPIES